MGYSATTKAIETYNKIMLHLNGGVGPQNTWVSKSGTKYFVEIGKENPDGAVTGSVFKVFGITAKRSGSMRIEPDGTVTRWTGTTKKQRL